MPNRLALEFRLALLEQHPDAAVLISRHAEFEKAYKIIDNQNQTAEYVTDKFDNICSSYRCLVTERKNTITEHIQYLYYKMFTIDLDNCSSRTGCASSKTKFTLLAFETTRV